MVTKEDNTGGQEETTSRVNLDKLELNKETVTDLTDSEEKMVKGGARPGSRECRSEPVAAACPE